MKGTIGLYEIWRSTSGHYALRYIYFCGPALMAFRNGKRTISAIQASVMGSMILKPWVAEITGTDATYGLARVFLGSKRDFSEASGSGKRIKRWFVLEEGKTYEVHEPINQRRHRRYFVRVSPEGKVCEVSKEEVKKWLDAKAVSSAC